MPLQPPTDYTRIYSFLVIGVSCVTILYLLTRSTLPHVGDNIHHLPHGGCYRDGTKSIYYGSAKRGSHPYPDKLWAFLAISGLVFAIYWTRPRRACPCTCPRCVEPSAVPNNN
ncbi:triple gene block protein 2 [Phaius virus X]|uniref:Triple gene block protein 2 n=1 Tax=Phaius virus X TaxID=457382 RepID=B0I2Z4_9VIRU|nr:triple gene block protein 2 [Phaius virus X]BAG06156.1 triple gene block protein 2 [Phaius virus X]